MKPLPFELDVIGGRLIVAAEIVEAQHLFPYAEKAAGGNMHPIRALYLAAEEHKDEIHEAAVRRLFDCCGFDFMDHGQDENIEDLVAASFWEVGFEQRRAA